MRKKLIGAITALSVIGVTGAAPELGCISVPDAGKQPVLATHVQDWRDEVIYQVLTDRFADGDVNNDYAVQPGALARYQGGDWLGIEQHLDYMQALGVTAIWISPVVKNVFTNADVDGYHGYWAQDLTQPNPYFGDLAALRSMVAAAHDRGLKVILDIVCNHMGQLFFYDMNLNGRPDDYIEGNGQPSQVMGATSTQTADPVVQYNEYDPDWDPRGVQAFSSDGNDGRAPIIFLNQPQYNQVLPQPAVLQKASSYHGMGHILDFTNQYESQYGDFTGGLKDLNTESLDVQKALETSYESWVTQVDFDAFRIDTIKHVRFDFWEYFLPVLRANLAKQGKKNFYVFGESFDGNDQLNGSYTKVVKDSAGNIVSGAAFDGIVYFPQLFTVYDGVFANAKLGNQSGTDVIAALWKQRSINYSTTPQDGGIVNAQGAGIAPDEALVNFVDNHDVGRFLFSSQGDKAALRNALALNMTAQGVPCLYYRTEQECSGGNDPANREVLWSTGFPTNGPTFTWFSKLAGIRKSTAALRHGLTNVVWSSSHVHDEEDAGIFAFERTGGDAGSLYALVVLATNDSHKSATAFGTTTMIVNQPAGTVLVDLADPTSQTYTVGPGGAMMLTPPRPWAPSYQSAMILVPQAQRGS